MTFFGLVAQSVEQRPFKPLVAGSSPAQPTTFHSKMPFVYILRGTSGRHYIGSTTDLTRRLKEHRRGHTYSTKRLGEELHTVASLEIPTLTEARALERALKRKKNARLALLLLQQRSNELSQ